MGGRLYRGYICWFKTIKDQCTDQTFNKFPNKLIRFILKISNEYAVMFLVTVTVRVGADIGARKFWAFC